MDNSVYEYDEVAVKPVVNNTRTDSYFDGGFFEYLGLKILALLITGVTLSIAKPWADKMIIEYQINHTVYNGKRLKFVGTGALYLLKDLNGSYYQ